MTGFLIRWKFVQTYRKQLYKDGGRDRSYAGTNQGTPRMLETTRSQGRSKERFLPRAFGSIAQCLMIQHGLLNSHHTSTFPELPFNTFTYILLDRIT